MPNRYPAIMRRLWYQVAKRLWCQLAISYTLLTYCAMMLLFTALYTLDDYNDFRTAVTLDNIEKRVGSEKSTVLKAIREADNAEFLGRARDNIRENLTNIEQGSGATSYRIKNSTRPEVYIRIADKTGHLLLSDPVDFPGTAAAGFVAPENGDTAKSTITLREENGRILVDMPITSEHEEVVGYLRVLYVAEFDILIQLQSTLGFLLHIWDSVFFCSVPVGVACGLMASRYVTKQLRKMNEVTESWRQGNFAARIALPNDDVLIRHSQHLNEMAQDLEMYLSLKQDLAVNRERNRVARELHDTVKQKLFALGLQLATTKTKPAVMETAREHILEAEAITREAQHDLMEIITQLRPAEIGDTSLYERIAVIAEDFGRRFGVSIALRHPESVRLNASTAHHVLRIVQEALTNAVRHGKASKIEITGTVDRDMASITIADDGSGFDPGQRTGGFGITSMRDRVDDLLCGTFEIRSAEGAGTQVTLSWKNPS